MRRRLYRLVLVLALPAIPLHELTHAAVAWPWADVRIEWRDDVAWYLEPAMRVRMDNWDRNAPTWAMLGAYVAPFIVGYAVAAAGVVLVWSGAIPTISLALGATVVVNWLLYTGASLADLDPIVDAVRASI